MVTPTDIKRYLSQCYNISKRLRELNEQIAEYRQKAMKQTYAWSDTPSGGHASASPQSVYIEKLVLLTDELDAESIKLLDAERTARELINRLDSQRETMFLEEYHVYRLTYEKMSLKHNYGQRQIYRIIGDAYRHLADIVNADAELERRITNENDSHNP